MLQHLLVSDDTLRIIQQKTKRDETMQELEAIIRKGWRKNKNRVPEHLRVYHYSQGSKELSDLRIGDVVRIKPLQQGRQKQGWTNARVESNVDICSYKVRREDGSEYRRNRRHLRQTKEDAQPAEQDLIAEPMPRMTSDALSYTTDPVLSPTRELPQPPQEQLPPSSPQEKLSAGPKETDCKPPTWTSGRTVHPPSVCHQLGAWPTKSRPCRFSF